MERSKLQGSMNNTNAIKPKIGQAMLYSVETNIQCEMI